MKRVYSGLDPFEAELIALALRDAGVEALEGQTQDSVGIVGPASPYTVDVADEHAGLAEAIVRDVIEARKRSDQGASRPK